MQSYAVIRHMPLIRRKAEETCAKSAYHRSLLVLCSFSTEKTRHLGLSKNFSFVLVKKSVSVRVNAFGEWSG
jgi:hypothetical protein